MNAIGSARRPRKQQIFEFDVIAGTLSAPKKVKIMNSLSWQDLFSYSVSERGAFRENFETIFTRYEGKAATASGILLKKLDSGDASIKPEMVDVFRGKYLNLLRNPHCVGWIPELMNIATSHGFTDPRLAQQYELVSNGRKPHTSAVCQRFQMTEEDYHIWLRTLFFVLARHDDGRSYLDRLIARFFDNSVVRVDAFRYSKDSKEYCLLSDRALNVLDGDRALAGLIQPGLIEAGNSLLVEFNLARDTYIRCLFLFDEALRADCRSDLAGEFIFNHVVDSMEELASYNNTTISQCAERVYCAKRDPLLA